ncbi:MULTISPECIES: YqcC family protein [Alkalimonas]|uniref:YqcC family protein n=1 Tax=Alkalimonas mucilaginosa TaxID=3057676 RepID=A0ABU7JHL6_9GAMM|nr:YqcC family protein [Alkalimonas sp. MEB004]MEE2024610.1 YqcC family protein [Alkalimonas sp. MEB004]
MSQLIVAALQEIKAELKALELWSPLPPSPEAMASTAPFCCDTMPFEHWLQFVLLPRMQALLDGDHPLPEKVSILPMAEVALAKYSQDTRLLLYWIGRFDACFQTD